MSSLALSGRVRAARLTSVSRPLRFSGVGLHSGREVWCELRPSACGALAFRAGGGAALAASAAAAGDSALCTELRGPGLAVRTVEHVLAALWAAGVASCDVALHGGAGGDPRGRELELPVLDGSALPFSEALRGLVAPCSTSAGIRTVPTVRVLRRVEVVDEARGSRCELSPLASDAGEGGGPTLALHVEVDTFGGRLPPSAPAVAQFTFGAPESAERFLAEFAAARTFGFESDAPMLRARGLALGASLDNAVVFKGDGSATCLNAGGLRLAEEWVRHKLLDCVGDLALCLGSHGTLHGAFRGSRPGHATTLKLLRALLSDPANFAIER
jgi:UDP-3-O-[3-hydroxymyristoyl] N-acetylglucosamine deacetylase